MHEVYRRTIAFGGHPNERGVLSATTRMETDETYTYAVAQLTDRPLLITTALKATIEDVAAHYANGFEGGLSTSGPTGGMPAMGDIDPATFSPQAGPPTHFVPSQSPWSITTPMLGIPLLLE